MTASNDFLRAMEAIEQEDEWYALGPLGQYITAANPDFDTRTYGSAKLSDLIRATEREYRSCQTRPATTSHAASASAAFFASRAVGTATHATAIATAATVSANWRSNSSCPWAR